MATTVTSAFATLRQNLEITSIQATTVSTRQSNVRDALKSSITVLDSFLTGSYMRSTMISPLSEADIDIFVVLDSKYYHHYNGQNGRQAGLLDWLKRTLLKTYTRTPDISRDGQAVTIRFSDFVVDIVPAFNRSGGGYLIPSSLTQTWISTDPKKHVELVTAANKLHEGKLVPLIKMIKAWNRNNSKFFRSFHLEVLALQIFQNVTISDFPSGMRFFFDKGKDLINQKNLDPAGYGGDVGYYINTADKIEQAVTKFRLAYERALEAEGYNLAGNNRAAIENWIKIFGSTFPTYG